MGRLRREAVPVSDSSSYRYPFTFLQLAGRGAALARTQGPATESLSLSPGKEPGDLDCPRPLIRPPLCCGDFSHGPNNRPAQYTLGPIKACLPLVPPPYFRDVATETREKTGYTAVWWQSQEHPERGKRGKVICQPRPSVP